ncbi:hypothetical protein [Pseudonocardia alni]|uniref:Uncharacterized protein n=1 Tax=Pseudonocardia alni subsp. carboxydivorans TaxID=415010 RepID=A0ABU9AKC1_PSEA5
MERSSDVIAPAEDNAEFGIELRASDMTSAVPPEPSVPEVVADAGRRRPDVLLRGDLRDR